VCGEGKHVCFALKARQALRIGGERLWQHLRAGGEHF
jgi:hypothetical protein